jgi:hypothetical protein
MDALSLPLMLTAMDVGLWLSLPTRQVERMARHGEIPCIRLPTGEILFDRAELLMWLDSLRDQPTEVRQPCRA